MNAIFHTMTRSFTCLGSSFVRHGRHGLLLALAMVLLPAAASAVDVVQCVGTEVLKYSPGLTFTPQATTVKVRDDLAICAGVSSPPVASAVRMNTVQLTTSCLDVLGGSPGLDEAVYTWNTGDTSTFLYEVSVQRVGTVVIITQTGEITAGLFAGATAVVVSTLVSPSLLSCLGPPGVKELGGPLLMTIALVE